MSQPTELFNVRVQVVCNCGGVSKFCVPVDMQVPKELRCTLGPPTGGGGAGAVRCPNGHPCGIGLSELRNRALLETTLTTILDRLRDDLPTEAEQSPGHGALGTG